MRKGVKVLGGVHELMRKGVDMRGAGRAGMKKTRLSGAETGL